MTSAFTFQIRKGVEIPPAARTAGFVHPFPWGDMKPGDSFTVPKDYWTKGRGIEEKNATAEAARNRILATFKTWQKAHKRDDVMIVTRTHKDDGSVEVWLRAVDETAAPAPEAPAEKPAPAKAKGKK